MAGDMKDLSTLLELAKDTFYDVETDEDGDPLEDDDGPIFVFDMEIRSAVAAASLRLSAAFIAAEQAHRSEHSVCGTKKETQVTTFRPRFAMASRLIRVRRNTARTTASSPTVAAWPCLSMVSRTRDFTL